MSIDIEHEVAAMGRMSIAELRERYERVFGETTTTRHAPCLVRRIAWRLQANELGGLSERARQRAQELANDAELRLTAPKAAAPPASDGQTVTRAAPAAIRDAGDAPVVGERFERLYKGQKIVAVIAKNGVRWEGRLYRSLTAVAKAVTGNHWNGFHFFGLKNGGEQ